MARPIFETYNNDVMPHDFHTQKTSSDMAMVTMCPFLQDQNDFTERTQLAACLDLCRS